MTWMLHVMSCVMSCYISYHVSLHICMRMFSTLLKSRSSASSDGQPELDGVETESKTSVARTPPIALSRAPPSTSTSTSTSATPELLSARSNPSPSPSASPISGLVAARPRASLPRKASPRPMPTTAFFFQ